jgi:hypothetical protein
MVMMMIFSNLYQVMFLPSFSPYRILSLLTYSMCVCVCVCACICDIQFFPFDGVYLLCSSCELLKYLSNRNKNFHLILSPRRSNEPKLPEGFSDRCGIEGSKIDQCHMRPTLSAFLRKAPLKALYCCALVTWFQLFLARSCCPPQTEISCSFCCDRKEKIYL